MSSTLRCGRSCLAQASSCSTASIFGRSAEELGTALGISAAQAQRVIADIGAKRRATEYLGGAPELLPPRERTS